MAVKKTGKKNKKATKGIRREIYGIIYIIFAVLTLFSLLKFDGFILGFYYKAVAFFIGFGIYILPVSLIWLGVLCFKSFKGNTKLRSTTIFLQPILIACFIHVLINGSQYSLSFRDITILISKGIEGTSAGFIGSIICLLLEAGLSTIGALIVLLILIIASIFISINISPIKAYTLLMDYFDSLAYEEDEDEITAKLTRKEIKRAENEKKRILKLENEREKQRLEYEQKKLRKNDNIKNENKARFNIDIPLDDNDFDLSALDKLGEKQRPKVDAWIVEAYEKIKDRNEKERVERLKKEAKQINQHPDTIQDMIKIDESISEQIDITSAEDFEIRQDTTEIFTQEFEIANQVSNEIESILSDKDVKEIIEKIEVDEETEQYIPQKENIEIDDLASTMKYQVDDSFNKETLEYEYKFPPIDLLTPKLNGSKVDPTEELRDSSTRLIETLESFGIKSNIINIVRGPSITRFEITISKGVKFSKITSLSDDIALSLGAANVRIAPIPDKVAIGIEVPNKTTEMVLISEVISSKEFISTQSKLSYALGKDITGSPALGDIAKMPHMLVAGTTGSGKSVCINSLLVSILYKADPTQVKFIMIDPKMVELAAYNGIPHLLIPVVTDPKKAAGALSWAVAEMMKRYKLFAENSVKDLVSYNLVMERKIAEGSLEAEKMPQVVIVIDELADLMMIAAKEVEESICRIAQMARAAGMHLVIATQRPSSDVITGIMKANIPSRISFAVSSQIESRIILDTTGAEKLIGKGDMLYNPLGVSKPQRLQGCFISSTEVESVVEFVKTIAKPDYNEEVLNHIETHAVKDAPTSTGDSGDEDEMIDDAIDIIVSTGQASTSFLQRKLKLGYSRASRIMDQIEERGIIGAYEGSKPRQILISKEQWQEMKIRKMN